VTDKTKLKEIRSALRGVIAYPDKNDPRRTKDGYPLEIIYDVFAYKRIVRSYREALKEILRDYK